MGQLYKLPSTGLGEPTDLLNTEIMAHNIVALNATTPVLLNSGIRRTRVIVQNYADSASSIYIGSSDVAASGARRGIEIAANSGIILDFTNDIALYGITSTGTVNALVVELF